MKMYCMRFANSHVFRSFTNMVFCGGMGTLTDSSTSSLVRLRAGILLYRSKTLSLRKCAANQVEGHMYTGS